MVDIHCHILWGLDDGAKTLDDSVAMARIAADSGTTDIVATPHANNQFRYNPELIRERAVELNANCPDGPKIHLGCDFHLSFNNIENALDDPRPYTINQSRYLMVELPELLIPPDMGHVFERLRQVGVLPVVTHPERNRALWRDESVLDNWLSSGIYVQITAQSLEGHFGRSAKDRAWRLLEDGKVHFVASDGHNTEHRPPRLDRAYFAVQKQLGEELALRVFFQNPAAALAGGPVTSLSPTKKQKSLFRLFR